MKTVALVGNPNCGKTTLFNLLTGANQHIGNYPGVTVEKKEGYFYTEEFSAKLIDLPGLYGLSQNALDQQIASNFLIHQKPDLIINVVDVTHLHRHLHLTIQLLELQVPIILVLNMIDHIDFKQLNIKELQKSLGVPVVATSGNQKIGIQELIQTIETKFKQESITTFFKLNYASIIEFHIQKLEALLKAQTHLNHNPRWLAIKLLEDTQHARHYLVDSITNLHQIEFALSQAQPIIQNYNSLDNIDADITSQRYKFIKSIIKKIYTSQQLSTTRSDKIDEILTHKIYGLPIFFIIIYSLFYIMFEVGAYPQEILVELIALFSNWIYQLMPDSELKYLLVDGVIGGVGAVISFLPSMIILYIGMSIMEDSGYIARVAFLMDGIMNRFGLHGKSCIPLILGFGCNVPAILSTRMLENERDRITTILIIPMMSCSAKLAVYTLLVNTFFTKNEAPFILFLLYIFGLIIGLILSLLLKNTLFKTEESSFIMEMPRYQMPILRNIMINVWERIFLYLKKAGTLILSISILVWFATNYPNSHLKDPKERMTQSYAGQIGQAITPIMEPLGLNWQVGVSLTSAFIAKEVFISTFAVINHVEQQNLTQEQTYQTISEIIVKNQLLTPLSSISLMVFILIYSPCMATISIIKRETHSWNWAMTSVLFNTVLAWILAFLTYQMGLIIL